MARSCASSDPAPCWASWRCSPVSSARRECVPGATPLCWRCRATAFADDAGARPVGGHGRCSRQVAERLRTRQGAAAPAVGRRSPQWSPSSACTRAAGVTRSPTRCGPDVQHLSVRRPGRRRPRRPGAGRGRRTTGSCWSPTVSATGAARAGATSACDRPTPSCSSPRAGADAAARADGRSRQPDLVLVGPGPRAGAPRGVGGCHRRVAADLRRRRPGRGLRALADRLAGRSARPRARRRRCPRLRPRRRAARAGGRRVTRRPGGRQQHRRGRRRASTRWHRQRGAGGALLRRVRPPQPLQRLDGPDARRWPRAPGCARLGAARHG